MLNVTQGGETIVLLKRKKYAISDWVVHCSYGVGQITAIEEKPLYDGEVCRRDCYRVETTDGVYWFPVDQTDNQRIRLIATPRQLRRVLHVLKQPAESDEVQKPELKAKISRVRSNAALEPVVCLLQELFALNRERKLNLEEERTLKRLTKHLIVEYARSMEIKMAAARSMVFKMLSESDREANRKFFFGLNSSSKAATSH